MSVKFRNAAVLFGDQPDVVTVLSPCFAQPRLKLADGHVAPVFFVTGLFCGSRR